MKKNQKILLLAAVSCLLCLCLQAQEEKKSYSGIYPHLAYFNNEGECGTGAVVPWADRLWVITYAPHKPRGSSDKLYEITPELELIIRAESIGGTPANRMIHRESEQLNISSYFIDKERNVRTIPFSKMPGRMTGTARHLADPKNKLYIATMEEGLYEVDVKSLAVTELIKDGNGQNAVGEGINSKLPGYHGKGLYSGQGQLIYANNGENTEEARRDPFVASGALASWEGEGDWRLIKRAQFTEVTGPGGIYGNTNPETDPIWAVGWDARSLILKCLYEGKWHTYRLPKASHSYDGAHGWNTEWPRIRDIGEKDLLMTMHGMFWKFPKTFTPLSSAGISPRSTYLKVIGDFCLWKDQVVLGTDDTANKEFLNKRKVKAELPAPQSQSNLWFLKPSQLDEFGPNIGRGAVWLNDKVAANVPSDPYLVSGFDKQALHLFTDKKTTITLEIDKLGDGKWQEFQQIEVEGYAWHELDPELKATWMRLRISDDLNKATAWFHSMDKDQRVAMASPEIFAGIAKVDDSNIRGGVVLANSDDQKNLLFKDQATQDGYYVLSADMRLKKILPTELEREKLQHTQVPERKGSIEEDEASLIYIDDEGKRYRLPRHPNYRESSPLGLGRVCREVVTERDLFHCGGTFYELPAKNAAGFARVRPISSHNLAIKDYCSYRGLLVISGINLEAGLGNKHIIRSEDGETGLWSGGIDDLWSLGRPIGYGGPWKSHLVKAGALSDPYLMTGYEKKSLKLESNVSCQVTAQIDISGMGDWKDYRTFSVTASEALDHEFPEAFQCYWIRFKTDADTEISAQLTYE